MTRRTLGYFNYVIAFLMIAMLVVQLLPYIHYGVDENGVDQSVSVIRYVLTPYKYMEMDKYMKDYVDGFHTGCVMFIGAIIPILSIVGFFYVLRKRGLSPIIFATAWSVISLVAYLVTPFCRYGSLYILHLIVLILATAVSIFCLVTWIKMPKAVNNDKEETFEKDPRASSKVKLIERAVEKKDVRELLDHAVSLDKEVRLKAVEGLGEVGGESAFNLLVPMLRNTDVDCRSAAAKALGKVGDMRALAFIYDRLGREENDSVKQILLDSMAQLHSKQNA